MLQDIVAVGTTSYRGAVLRVIDSTDGTPETGVAYNTSGIDLWYRKVGGARTAITEATLAAVDSAYSSGGFIHISDGYCRLDLPNAALDTEGYVDFGGTATGMVMIGGRIKVGPPPVNAIQVSGTTLTARDIGASVLLSNGTGTGQISLSSGAVLLQATQTGVTIPTVTTLTNLPAITANWLTAAGIAADAGAEIADAVWDEALAGHAGAGSAGEALSAAGTAGDPWTTALPGAYGAGTAGSIIGNNLNATVSSRATQTSVDTIDDLLDTEVAALITELAKVPKEDGSQTFNATCVGNIKSGLSTQAELDKVPKSDGTTTWNATALGSIQSEATDALNAYDPATGAEVAAVAAYVDTEVAAILAAVDTEIGALATAVADVPTVAEFEARTLPSADYFDASTDGVTLANGAHGGAAATLTLKSVAVTNGDNGGTAVGIVANGTGGQGLVVSGTAGDIVADITGNLSGSAGSVTGAVGSVTGAVGSVTGNVGGNVAGSVASVTGDVGGNVTGTVAGVTPATSANVLAQVQAALNEAFTDATSLTSNGIKDRLRRVLWIIQNKIEIVDASGDTTIYGDDNTTAKLTGNVSDNSTTTTRTRMA